MKDEPASNASSVKIDTDASADHKEREIAEKELHKSERSVRRYLFFILSLFSVICVLVFAWFLKTKLLGDLALSPQLLGQAPIQISLQIPAPVLITPTIAADLVHSIQDEDPISMSVIKKFLDPDTTLAYSWLFPAYLLSVTLLIISLFVAFYTFLIVAKAEISYITAQSMLFSGILNHLNVYLSLIGTLVVANLIVPFPYYYGYSSSYYNSLLYIPDWVLHPKAVSSTTIWIYDRVLPGLFKAIGIILVKELIVYLINFNIHYKYYKLRIEQNEDRLKVARKMIDLTNSEYSEDILNIATKFINYVGNGNPVTLPVLRSFFSDEISYKISAYCNMDDELTAEDVKKFFETTIIENSHLKSSIEYNNATVARFGNILLVIIIPLVLYQIFDIILTRNNSGGNAQGYTDGWTELTRNTYLLGTMVFSTNYTFSDTLKGFANSLVYVFFMRPFEIGDMVVIDENIYKVHEINLLTTLLFNGREFTTFVNSELCRKTLKNLRLNGIWEVSYDLKFKLGDIKTKQKAIVNHLTAYVATKTSEFKKGVFISSVDLGDEGKTTVKITAKLNCNVASVETLVKRRTALFFKIQEILDNLPA